MKRVERDVWVSRIVSAVHETTRAGNVAEWDDLNVSVTRIATAVVRGRRPISVEKVQHALNDSSFVSQLWGGLPLGWNVSIQKTDGIPVALIIYRRTR